MSLLQQYINQHRYCETHDVRQYIFSLGVLICILSCLISDEYINYYNILLLILDYVIMSFRLHRLSSYLLSFEWFLLTPYRCLQDELPCIISLDLRYWDIPSLQIWNIILWTYCLTALDLASHYDIYGSEIFSASHYDIYMALKYSLLHIMIYIWLWNILCLSG